MIWKLGKTQYSFLKTVTSNGTLVLLADSQQFQIFSGTLNHTLRLPDATTTSNGDGINFVVVNESTGTITVQLNDTTTLTTLDAGQSKEIILTSDATSNGTWRVASFAGASGGGIGSVSPGSIVSSNYSIQPSDSGRVLNVDTSSGNVDLTLPAPSNGFIVTIKDLGGTSSLNRIKIIRNASELIDENAADKTINTAFTAITLISNGTDWFVISDAILNQPSDGIAVFGGGFNAVSLNTIDYVNISTAANALDFGDLTVARYNLSSCASSTRGLFIGGFTGSASNVIDYITIATTGNATDFGDLTSARYGKAACGNQTRGLIGGGEPTELNIIEYVDIATTGNSIDFGDLVTGRSYPASCSSNTRGVWGGGGTFLSSMDYVNIATLANALSFGNLTIARRFLAACSSSVRGIFGGGDNGSRQNTIDYITIATTGNATDFGDLSANKNILAAASSKITGLFAGGSTGSVVNVIEYVDIATTSNVVDFGDLTVAREGLAGTSNCHGGI